MHPQNEICFFLAELFSITLAPFVNIQYQYQAARVGYDLDLSYSSYKTY